MAEHSPESTNQTRRIAAAVDLKYKPGIQSVLHFACCEAMREGDALDIICVLDQAGDFNVDSTLVAGIREEILAVCSEEVGDKLVREIPYEVHVVMGKLNTDFVVDSILGVSEKTDSSLVVVATHGRGPIKELFLGSVASMLLHKSSVPLAITRPEHAR